MDSKPKPARTRLLSRFFKWLMGIILGLVIVLGIGLVWLSMPSGEKTLLKIIHAQIEKIVQEPVTIGHFETNILTRAILSDITVTRIDSNASPLLTLKSLTIRYSLGRLIFKKIALKEIRLDDCQVWVTLDSSNTPYLPHLVDTTSDTTSAPGQWEIELSEFILTNSQVHVVAPGLSLNSSLQNLNVSVQSESSGYDFSVQAETGLFQPESDLPPESFDISGFYIQDSISISRVAFTTNTFGLTGNGAVFSQNSIWSQRARIAFTGQPQPILDFVAGMTGFETPLVTGATRTLLTSSGLLTNPILHFSSDLGELTAVGSPALNGHVSGLVTRDSVRIDTMDLRLLGGNVAGNSVLSLDSLVTKRTSVRIQHIDVSNLLAYAYPNPADYTGTLDGSLEIAGPLLDWIDLDFNGHLAVTDAEYYGKAIPATDLLIDFSDQKASAVLTQGNNTVEALFHNYSADNLKGSFEAQLPNLAPLTALMGYPQLVGALAMQGDLSGTFGVPVMTANVRGSKLLYDNIVVDSLGLNVKTTGTNWRITDGQASGYIPQIASVPFFPATLPLEADLHYQVTVAGNMENLTGDAQLQLSHLKYDVYPADSMALDFKFRDQTITLHSGQLFRESEHAQFSGDFNWQTLQSSLNLKPSFRDSSGWQEGGQLSVQAVLVDSIWSLSVNANSLNTQLAKPYSGSIQHYSGLVNAEVTIADPFDELDIRGRIAVVSPQFTSLQLDAIETEFILTPQRFTIQSLSAEKNRQHLNLAGTIPLDSHWGIVKTEQIQAEIKTAKLELSWFKDFLPEGFSADGIVTTRISVTGTVVQPIFKGTAELAEAELNMPDLPPLLLSQCNFKIDSTQIELTRMDGMVGDYPLHVLGTLDYTTPRHFDAHVFANLEKAGQVDLAGQIREKSLEGSVTITRVDLNILTPFLAADQVLNGILSSQLKVNGSLSSPQINGEIKLANGQFKLGETTPAITNINLVTDFKDTTITLKTLAGEISETLFSVTGEIHQTNWRRYKVDLGLKLANYDALQVAGGLTTESLALSVKASEMNLAVFQPFLPGITDLTGKASADLKVSGTFAQPDIRGDLVARHVNLSPDYFDGPLSHGLLKLHFAGNRWQIDSLNVNQGKKGRVALAASIDISNSQLYQIDASLSVRHIQIKKFRLVEGTVESADIQYRTGDSYQNLTGDIILGRFKYIKRFSPNELLAIAQPTRTVQAQPALVLQQTRFNIRLHESEQVWIDNNLAYLRFKPDISLIGSLAQPNITGRIAVKEGYILYLDRHFDVNTGILDFSDPHRLNPMINLQTVAHLKPFQTRSKTAYEIFLNITGDLETPIVTLTSSPALDKTDILALLTIGATRTEMAGNTTDSQNTTLARVIQDRLADYSSQRISGYTSRRLGTFLGLEEMSIEGNLFNFGPEWGPQLVTSKRLSENMKVTYSTTVGHATDQSIKLEYSITDQIVLESQTDQHGRAGVDLKYRIKFK
ncbi:MAG: translocation/assembly module TamB domain-containing protein [Candidatus Marinimicrobia bacterium]|nr:translocation/assembly module TamB domain-containing protein [Candidatus Neomarinimicrobiota bacterium]MCF7839623.1 translocation/assembly module TamB domain-containing protein [Candidatus Neomarinimicrobiota bacterium]MCF7902512.1 translocation/assembly module TamB domain-containing protein [Candidatus Neomarinimicrobiota bacterium]